MIASWLEFANYYPNCAIRLAPIKSLRESRVYKFQAVDGFTVVTGYPDGKDWIFEGIGRSGIINADGDWLWQIASDRTFRVYDILQKTEKFRLELDNISPRDSLAVAGLDGQFIYLICPSSKSDDKPKPSRIYKLETVTGTILCDRDGPTFNGIINSAVIMPDGALLLATFGRRDEKAVSLMTRFDPSDLKSEESFIEMPKIPAGYRTINWLTHSPDGKYWFRQDHSSLPIEKRSAGPGQPERRYYGLTLQMWTAFPLKFEKRIVVAWLKAEELPDATNTMSSIRKRIAEDRPQGDDNTITRLSNIRGKIFGRKTNEVLVQENTPNLATREMLMSAPERDRLWSLIALGFKAADHSGNDPFPSREDFGTQVEANDDLWNGISKNLNDFYDSGFSNIRGWQTDGKAFWMDRSGFLICVGIDGHVSPRLWSERMGFKTGMVIPWVNQPHRIEIGTDRRLTAVMPDVPATAKREGQTTGTMIYEGVNSIDRFEPLMISIADDGWEAGLDAIPKSAFDKDKYTRKVRKIRKDRSTIRIPLTSMECTHRLEAINSLIQIMDRDFPNRACDHQINISFELGGTSISEQEFFDSVADRDRDWALPALKSLIERFVAVSKFGKETVYSFSDKGECLFGHAVLRLAQLDHSSLPLIQQFGQLMDGGHEYYFPSEIIPALIKAHGWTEEMLDFGFWVILFNFYNTYDDPTRVWRDFGLAKALSGKDPIEIARRVVSVYEPEVESERLNWNDLFHLKKCLGSDITEWDRIFFEALENILPDFTVS